ncbi:M48 family metallopeptidase [Phaeobacter inhibens]|uniref:Putative metal-dependent hydrolase n=1 Tax=Phaeobacter inhibens TaxID=221822 RepID=A0A2I7KDX2_9RHOB|nr:SprT family zinc-dependent metalloprotease [Phaeobacter inhibens]AUR00786.1 putative metal-dependent hydrolase [Phaeobacter inhibens]
MSETAIIYGDQRIPYVVNVDDKRTTRVAIHVEPDGKVIVDAPPGFAAEAIQAAVQKRARWVVSHVEDAKARFAHVRPREYVSGEQVIYLGRRYVLKVLPTLEKPRAVRLRGNRLEVETRSSTAEDVRSKVRAWYRVKARDYFAKRIAEASQSLPWIVEMPPFRLLEMNKQWGSCSADGQVILNPHLVKAPRECIEYVVMHELAHLKYHDHGPEFWQLLDVYSPQWRQSKGVLDAMVEVLAND